MQEFKHVIDVPWPIRNTLIKMTVWQALATELIELDKLEARFASSVHVILQGNSFCP